MGGPRVRVEAVKGSKIRVSPYDRIEQFDKYLAACRSGGMHWNPAVRAQEGPLTKATLLLTELTNAGFTPMADSQILDLAQREVARAAADVQAATGRMAEIETELQSRGLSLYGYQKDGTKWLASRKGAMLSDSPGLGKTLQALVALPDVAILAVVPAVAKGVWKREAKKWRKDLKVTVLKGKDSFRWPEPGELVVTNYDVLWNPDQCEPLPPKHPVALVADEAHVLRNHKSIRSRAFGVLRAQVQKVDGWVWGLTATPMLGKALELWGTLKSLGLAEEAFGGWNHFLFAFRAYEGRFGLEFGEPRTDLVKAALQKVSLRRLREDVLSELPPKTYAEIDVELDTSTVKKLDKLVDKLTQRNKKTDKEWTAEEIDTRISRAFNAGIDFEVISQVRSVVSAAKLDAVTALVEDLEAQGEPVVVFCTGRETAAALGSRQGWACITGETSAAQRTKIEDDFQAGKLKGIAGTIMAMGVAITLTHAATAIFVDKEWTPELNNQAEDRLARIGQTRNVTILSLIGDHPLERRINTIIAEKAYLIAKSVQASSTVGLTAAHDRLGVISQAS